MTSSSEFDDPRIALVYDVEEGERDDLTVYELLAEELGARSVLDIGAGTGVLARRLHDRGLDVTAVEPAGAMLDRALSEAEARAIAWVHGYAHAALPIEVDLVTMTGNTAQVFDDEQWWDVLDTARRALRPGGHLVFEVRVRERRAWEAWRRADTTARFDVPGIGAVTTWVEVTDVREVADGDGGEVVTFEAITELPDETIRMTSTLRFRPRAAIEEALGRAGFQVREVRDAPDRPGQEWVFIAQAV